MPAALALYKKMLPIVRWVGGRRYVAASKDGLTMMGLPVGKPRAPRLPLARADAPRPAASRSISSACSTRSAA